MRTDNIRNFVIIAHVDHGKSTLADRFLELTGTIAKRQFREQFLDQMEIERERGITIKMQPVRMGWRRRGRDYVMNLIDTPGHVDFSYEVSRSLAAVEGAILLVDGTQGIQAQTLAHLAIAKAQGLKVLGAINKIDLAIPDIESLAKAIAELIGVHPDEIHRVSAKTAEGVEALLDAVIEKIPPPADASDRPSRALIFDSHYDAYRGVISYVRVKEGKIAPERRLCLAAYATPIDPIEVGFFRPELSRTEALSSGDIGYVATGLKHPGIVRVGDTIGDYDANGKRCLVPPLPGYLEPQPLLFAGFYPREEGGVEPLRDAFSKLKLNDAALTYEPERAMELGKGFRVGFLGALHLEITKDRLLREYGLEPLITMPSVRYLIVLRDGTERYIATPQELPSPDKIAEIREPWAVGEIITPTESLGDTLALIRHFRGNSLGVETLGKDRAVVRFEAPLAELIVNFYDRLKSVTRGYASVAYDLKDWRPGDLVKLDILIAGKQAEALSRIVPHAFVQVFAKAMTEKLKGLLGRELFPVPIQAAVAGRIIARETIPALKKDVTGYLYGGDRTRKMKLWKKQQAGKKKLSAMGRVRVKPEVLFEMLKIEHGT